MRLRRPRVSARFRDVRTWIAFSDLHLTTASQSVAMQVLDRVHAEAVARDAGVIFLGDFWHHRGKIPVEPLNAAVEKLALWRRPTIMLTGPAPASRKALKQAGMNIGDIDLIEVNEAFSAIPMLFMEEMGLSHDIVNVNGGAIAMGHPLGATGCMLTGTLMDEMERRDLNTGLVTLCIAGGMGIATIIERV